MNFFSRYLDTAGNGTGDKNANGDYSRAVQLFRLDNVLASALDMLVEEFVVKLAWNPAGDAYSPNKYGGRSILRRGITFGKTESAPPSIVDITDGTPVRINADWTRFGPVPVVQHSDDSREVLHITFCWRLPSPIVLNQGEVLAVVLNDDFSSLAEHYFRVNGKLV